MNRTLSKCFGALSCDGCEQGTQIIRTDSCYNGLVACDDVREFYSESSNFHQIVDAIAGCVDKNGIKVLSFDVFDTTLLREGKSEARRFWEISERFVQRCGVEGVRPEFSAGDVFLARVTSARAAYAMAPYRVGNLEGNFNDIARGMCDILQAPELTPCCIANELEYEQSVLVENPLVWNVLRLLPEVKVIFVSDMYLESDKIKYLLRSVVGTKYSGEVYSSADGLGSKRNGGIFSSIKDILNVHEGQLLHVGDNIHADYKIPKAKGWKAFFLPLPDKAKRDRMCCHDRLKSNIRKFDINLDDFMSFNM